MLESVQRSRPAAGGEVSSVGLAAIVAVLHVAVLSTRVAGRSAGSRPAAMLAWTLPSPDPEAAPDATRVPSKPMGNYCAGRLELTAGMAVLVLSLWLHIMRIQGTHAD